MLATLGLMRGRLVVMLLGATWLINGCYPDPYERDNAADPGSPNYQVVDEDGDGFGEEDCDDSDPTVYPDAAEVCDGIDQDCDGLPDDGLPTTDYYIDEDGDGYGDVELGFSAHCGDPDPTLNEVIRGGDCNDTNNDISPAAEEVCNGVDDNCDGVVDEGLTDAYYFDGDQDGFGDGDAVEACSQPDLFVSIDGDCDDTNADVNPNGAEICDGIDNNCSGVADEGLTVETWFADADEDGFGDSSLSLDACAQPEGYTLDDTDCDDSRSSTYPSAPELCDGLDNNCDGTADEGLPIVTYYRDADGDLYGTEESTTQSCALPDGYAALSGDCDDTDASINPEAQEVCDGIDNNCDGQIDEGFVLTTYFPDQDGDGFGLESGASDLCQISDGLVEVAGDCDDNNPEIYPGAPSVCNGLDNDCDGNLDGFQDFYQDLDGDGYGTENDVVTGCSPPTGYAGILGDCDDDNSGIYPGADEVCDGLDNDCDGAVDEDLILSTVYLDGDTDGYGDSSTITEDCGLPDGYAAQGEDCNDADPDVYPGADEVCDGTDRNCDGIVPVSMDYYPDQDQDSYGDQDVIPTAQCVPEAGLVTDGSDCDDGDPDVYPGADEFCDGKDNDCDGTVDNADAAFTFYPDDDGDGFGRTEDAVTACAPVTGYTNTGGDCDDTDDTIHPEAVERLDGVDNDCDGTVDMGIALLEEATRQVLGSDGAACPASVATGLEGYGTSMQSVELDGLVGEELLVQVSSTKTNGFCYWTGEQLPDGSSTASFLITYASTVHAAVSGDFDGDGWEDLAVGLVLEGDFGAVYFFMGTAEGFSGAYEISDATLSYQDGVTSSGFGSSLIAVDADGDGRDELLVGAPLEEGRGTIHLLSLSSEQGSFQEVSRVLGATSTDQLGTAMVREDPDGGTRFWASSPAASTGAALYLLDVVDVFAQADTVADVLVLSLRTLSASNDGLEFGVGETLTMAGDMDGDGYLEVMTTSYQPVSGQRVYLVWGVADGVAESGGLADAASLLSGLPLRSDNLVHVTGLGDFDGDGFSDLALSTRQVAETGYDGLTYLMYGSTTRIPSADVATVAEGSLIGPASDSGSDFPVLGLDSDGLLLIASPDYRTSDGIPVGSVQLLKTPFGVN